MNSGSSNRVVVVTGSSGVGKDYLAAKSSVANTVNWGTHLGQVLGVDPDDIASSVDPEVVARAQFEACRAILEMQPVLVTCHTVRRDKWGAYYFDIDLELELNPACYIFVRAPAGLIAQRVRQRNRNGARRCPEHSVEHIRGSQVAQKRLLQEISRRTGAPLHVLTNTDDFEASNVEFLRKEMKELGGWLQIPGPHSDVA